MDETWGAKINGKIQGKCTACGFVDRKFRGGPGLGIDAKRDCFFFQINLETTKQLSRDILSPRFSSMAGREREWCPRDWANLLRGEIWLERSDD